MRYTKSIYILIIISLLFSCKSKKPIANTDKKSDKSIASSDKQSVDFAYKFYNACREKMVGNIENAAALYAQCLKINPNHAASLYELGNIYAYQGNYKYAIAFTKKAIEFDPKNEWYNILLADCYTKVKKYNEAIKIYQSLVKYYPERIDFVEELATAQLYANKIKEALDSYDLLEKMIGVNESVSFQKTNIYKKTGQYSKAILELNKLMIAFPKEPKYYGSLGELYHEMGEKEKAFQAYQELLKRDPENGLVHLSLAEYYRANKENELSFNEMKKAFQNTNVDIDSKVKILLTYYYMATDSLNERKNQGVELCKIMTEIYPDDAKSYSVYGDFLYRDKKKKEARDQYRKAIAVDKEKYLLWNQLLIIDSELNDIDAMYSDGNQAAEFFPNQPLPYLLKGAAALQLKKYVEAVQTLNLGKDYVVDNKPLLGQFYATLGDAYNKIPNNALSDEAYDKALELDSNNVFVLNNYAYYLSLRKENLDKAERMSKRTNEITPQNNSYLDTYGWILYQMEKYEDAKKYIGEALEYGGKNNSVILEHYGDVLFKLGEKEKALGYWIEAKQKGIGSEFLEKKVSDQTLYE